MSSSAMKGIGISCFVLCAILLFVAWERYDNNANAVEAVNRMMKDLTGSSMLKPSVPAATAYSLLGAALSAIGGVVCFVAAAKKVPVAPSAADGGCGGYSPACGC